jgi:hypothetical protein
LAQDNSGDGTVPRVSATPLELSNARREIFVSEVDASLQNFNAGLVNLTGILTGSQIKAVQKMEYDWKPTCS